MPEKSGTDAPRRADDAGAAATAASAAAMHGICLSFIAAPHHVRKTMLHRSGRAFTWCSTDKVGSPPKPKRGTRLGPRKRKPITTAFAKILWEVDSDRRSGSVWLQTTHTGDDHASNSRSTRS